jgi:uncharacterized surface protein with fasciclin (FAS1) repeats
MKKVILQLALFVGIGLSSVLQSGAQTVVDVIVNSENHDTLETAVIAAGLADDLSGAGPFTVFAPTDAAFAALPAGTVQTLLQDPTGALAQILLYHVASGNVLSTDLSNGLVIPTLQGEDVIVTIVGANVFINESLVSFADIPAQNGVVHVIDAVLMPPTPQTTTVVDIIVNSPDHTVLETAVIAAELVDDLSGTGPFTVFAPTDAAFAALPAGTLESLLLNPTGALADILLYHVASGNVLSTDLSDGQIIPTLNGATVTVTFGTLGVLINNALVTASDIQTDNGVVHVIDAVLLPPPTTVVDIIVNSPDHTTLEAAVIAAELADDLSGTGPFTVFAPTDAAFAALPAGTVEALLQNPTGELAQILLYHVASGSVLSTALSDGQVIPTLNGETVTVTINGGVVSINNAQVTVADILADNGVVHVINAVLLPPPTTVVDIIVNSPDHTILEAAVVAAQLADDLSGDGPFTVFAPTDAAFAALPAGTVESLLLDPLGQLAQILLYHVASGNVLSTDLSDGQTITTLNGATVTVTINGGVVSINNAQVTVADILADNGVVHVINAVLLPAPNSVNEVESSISIYPNPTTDFIFVNRNSEETCQYRIVSADGRVVMNGSVAGKTAQLDVNVLPSGIYNIQLVSGSEAISSGFVKF